ncbi:DUF6924 domain-containing protein [[Kitasatospora] papulosa]|uniref:DUF6924 domain-containing protein n=1 Tax=[Kitasatospora] papulosa TaxID=1464011 RepID=UPI0038213123
MVPPKRNTFGPEQKGRKVEVLPSIGEINEEAALIVRTTYGDDLTWHAILRELRQPWGEDEEFETPLHIIDDPTWSGATIDKVRTSARVSKRGGFLFIVDSTTVRHSHFAMLAIEVDPEHLAPGATKETAPTNQTFRLEPAAVGEVHMLLSLGEKGFEEYVDEAERDSNNIVWSAF